VRALSGDASRAERNQGIFCRRRDGRRCNDWRRHCFDARNRIVTLQTLTGILEPALDVPAETLDFACLALGEARIAERTQFQVRYALPPLQAAKLLR
jgi:hypothetical protein